MMKPDNNCLLLVPVAFNNYYFMFTLLFTQTLLQNCLAPVAEDICAEITKPPGANNTPLHKIIK